MTDSPQVLMGVTVEDVQERIKRMNDQALQAEGFDIKAELNGLKEALVKNPDVVNELSEEELGGMIVALRTVHADSFAAAAAKKAPKKPAKPKGSTAKEIKAAANLKAEDIDLDAL